MDTKKKYKVNLPKTSFPMKASLTMREPERLKLWKKEGLENKIIEKSAKAKETFILHDGPPYANGHIHMGHALNKTLKDIIVRYKTHRGYNTTYVPGWDCHGLPIEHALLKELGMDKNDVDQLEFRKNARKYASKYIKIQREEFQRLGISGIWDHPYLTMSKHYQTSIARAFYELNDKGYIYRGEKPVYWSIGCETALAEAELEYQDKTSNSIYVDFPILNSPESQKILNEIDKNNNLPFSFIIWTTTPWTLPANVGVALHPELDYGIYLINGQKLSLFATTLEDQLRSTLELTSLECLTKYKGKQIKEILPFYQHPFLDRQGSVILADYVSAKEGTGIVHIAPGHGEDDYIFGHIQNKLPILSPVDHQGKFTEDFGAIKLKGINVFEANSIITEHLKGKDLLRGSKEHQHSYPYCWRSKTPVIVRSTPQWFLKVDHDNLRNKVMDIINHKDKTRWFPDWGKNRILGMIEARPDWCLSRQRLWGVPIPVAYHKDTEELFLSEKFKKRVLQVFEQEGADSWFSHPKKYFLQDEDQENLVFETDILDVWFDSGVSHQAVLNQAFNLHFPCDLYLEGSDQHRGWFQTSLITSVALNGEAPFKSVLTHGFVVDGQGKKMSKSQGNVVSPQEVMQKFGADVLRLWVSSCNTDSDIRLSPEILDRMAEAYRKIRNTFRYMLGNMADFDPKKDQVHFEDMESIDQWILSRLKKVSEEVTQCYEEYKFYRIYQIIYDFCIMDLSSFYFDALKDRLYCDLAHDPKRRSAQTTLFILTKVLCQLTSPILIFTTDEVWRNFPLGEETSIHESLWDESLWQSYSETHYKKWAIIRQVRRSSDHLIEKMRTSKEIGSSLDCQILLSCDNADLTSLLKTYKEDLEFALIVSKVDFEEEKEATIDLTWTNPEGEERIDKISLNVMKVQEKKCARCWKHLKTVGTLEDPDLCQRCYAVELA